MKHWLYAEPVIGSTEAIWMIYSNDAILAEYWDEWSIKVMANNIENGADPGTGVSPPRCIDDWVTIHWAVEATPENLLNILSAPKPQLL